MRLLVRFLGKDCERLGRDEEFLPKNELNDISKEEEIKDVIEKYLGENEEIKVTISNGTKVSIKSEDVKKVEIEENYLGGKSFSIDVTWD
ncbi:MULTISPECIES: hypothetical protein [unclassified Staphylococcus]|uniref:hypothetical protein n=1 Tax=unclassified Staphylococcus TaxID=91994 RepID=UPI001AEC000B|nr:MULTISPECIES: hypothetical protein [unclassified Staphylococcus]